MKAKTILGSLAILLASCQTSAQGWFGQKTIKESKNYVTKEINVENFTAINLQGSPTVTYTQQAGKPKVTVYTSDNIAEVLDIHTDDGTLYIRFKKGVNVSYKTLDIRVSSPRLEAVKLAGSGEIYLNDGLEAEDLQLSLAGSGDLNGKHIQCNQLKTSVAGSGDLHLTDVRCVQATASVAGSGDLSLRDLVCNSVEASVAGSGDIVLSGTGDRAQYSVAGSGDLKASALKVQQAEASVAGSGDITCHATEQLKARTTGSGNIGYKGNPRLDIPRKGIYKL